MILPRRVGEAVVLEVASETGVPVEDIMSPSRKAVHAQARRLAMHRLRSVIRSNGEPKYSLPQIGAFFDRDHTTVISALRRYEEECD